MLLDLLIAPLSKPLFMFCSLPCFKQLPGGQQHKDISCKRADFTTVTTAAVHFSPYVKANEL